MLLRTQTTQCAPTLPFQRQRQKEDRGRGRRGGATAHLVDVRLRGPVGWCLDGQASAARAQVSIYCPVTILCIWHPPYTPPATVNSAGVTPNTPRPSVRWETLPFQRRETQGPWACVWMWGPAPLPHLVDCSVWRREKTSRSQNARAGPTYYYAWCGSYPAPHATPRPISRRGHENNRCVCGVVCCNLSLLWPFREIFMAWAL